MDKEHETGSKTQTSTPRTLKHQQRSQLLLQIVERAVLSDPALRQTLAEQMAGALADDPALAEAFNALFRPTVPGPPVLLATSALVTGVLNTQASVLNTHGRVLNTATRNGVAARSVASSPPPPPVPLSPPAPPLSPVTPSTSLTTTGGTLAEPASAGRRDESFERMADGFYPGIKGDYDKLDRDARGLLNRSLAQLRAKMDEQGIPLEQRPNLISYGIRNLPNVARGTTPGNLVKHWMAAIAGADRNGRNGGVEIRHYVNHSGAVKHRRTAAEVLAEEEARRAQPRA